MHNYPFRLDWYFFRFENQHITLSCVLDQNKAGNSMLNEEEIDMPRVSHFPLDRLL